MYKALTQSWVDVRLGLLKCAAHSPRLAMPAARDQIETKCDPHASVIESAERPGGVTPAAS